MVSSSANNDEAARSAFNQERLGTTKHRVTFRSREGECNDMVISTIVNTEIKY